MTVLYKLAAGQLSKQSHYDFGLRALKAVLVMAGELKRGSPDLPEVSLNLIHDICLLQHTVMQDKYHLLHVIWNLLSGFQNHLEFLDSKRRCLVHCLPILIVATAWLVCRNRIKNFHCYRL